MHYLASEYGNAMLGLEHDLEYFRLKAVCGSDFTIAIWKSRLVLACFFT